MRRRAKVAREARRVRAASRRAAQARAREWDLSGQLRNTAIIAYVQAGYDAEPAVRFLKMAGRVRHWPDSVDEDLAVLVEDTFIAMESAEVADLTDEENPSDAAAMKGAATYVEEWRLCKVWAVRQNLAAGVAPSTEAMLAELGARRVDAGRDDAFAVGTVADSRARMFMTRMRRRWGGRFGSIPACEHLPLSEALPKALTECTSI